MHSSKASLFICQKTTLTHKWIFILREDHFILAEEIKVTDVEVEIGFINFVIAINADFTFNFHFLRGNLEGQRQYE